eukprot:427004-Rhodomonas_salina.1
MDIRSILEQSPRWRCQQRRQGTTEARLRRTRRRRTTRSSRQWWETCALAPTLSVLNSKQAGGELLAHQAMPLTRNAGCISHHAGHLSHIATSIQITHPSDNINLNLIQRGSVAGMSSMFWNSRAFLGGEQWRGN